MGNRFGTFAENHALMVLLLLELAMLGLFGRRGVGGRRGNAAEE